MQSIIKLNEYAVLLIENGMHKHALVVLDRALDNLQSRLADEGESDNDDNDDIDDGRVVVDDDEGSTLDGPSIESELANFERNVAMMDGTTSCNFDDSMDLSSSSFHSSASNMDIDDNDDDISNGNTNTASTSSTTRTTKSATNMSSKKSLSMPRLVPAAEEKGSFLVCPDNEDFVYKSPIRVSSLPLEHDYGDDNINNNNDNEICHQNVVPDELTLSVVLIFNMALCHHLRAINATAKLQSFNSSGCASPSTSRRLLKHKNIITGRLRKALKLYEVSFCLQMKSGGQLSMTQVLALVNNCGQIYKQLENTRKANKFFQHMLSTLMAMAEVGEADEVDEWDGFMWNASKIILSNPAVAPAA